MLIFGIDLYKIVAAIKYEVDELFSLPAHFGDV